MVFRKYSFAKAAIRPKYMYMLNILPVEYEK